MLEATLIKPPNAQVHFFLQNCHFPIFLYFFQEKKKKGKQAATGHIDMGVLQVNILI